MRKTTRSKRQEAAQNHAPADVADLGGASGLLGLSPYLYCVVQGGPDAAWGSWGYHRSLSGLWTHVTRGEYGTFRLASIDEATNTQTWLRISAYLTSLPGELPAGGPTTWSHTDLQVYLSSGQFADLGTKLSKYESHSYFHILKNHPYKDSIVKFKIRYANKSGMLENQVC